MVGFQSQFMDEAPHRAGWVGEWLSWPRLTFEVGIVCFAVGIAVYFALPTEPSLLIVAGACMACLLVSRVVLEPASPIMTMFLLLCLGLSWATVHSRGVSPNPMGSETRLALSGWVSEIDDSRSMRRIELTVRTAEPMPPSGLPERIRLRVGRSFQPVSLGDGLALDAVVGPLPGPAIPNGYDPGRRAFFDGLAGSGFAIDRGRLIPVRLTALERMQLSIARTRAAIADKILSRAPEATAGLQVALLTGIRDHIPEKQTQDLRASGLAHVLAISGLHMGMVAFGVYVAASAALAAIPSLSRGRDVRKYAALIGIASASLYLILSGASVATQRAYIMVCIAFLAILFDRRAISIRSVAVAALVTLAIRPEALVSVGFQMSFAAVASMVVIFRAMQDRWPRRKALSIRDRVGQFYGSLFGTSLIAGLATGGFALLHFGRIARYGLIANLAAMTVFPAVMAVGVIALLAMPVGLEGLPLWCMSQLLVFMLWVAERVSEMPGAVDTVKASQPWVIAIYGLGFAVACLGTRRSVAIGCAAMLISILAWTRAPTYDVRIDRNGRLSVIRDGRAVTSSLRADRYGREQFARSRGQPDQSWTAYRDTAADCDSLACRLMVGAMVITVIEAPSEAIEACADSDLVLLATRDAGPVARRSCGDRLIDRHVLSRTGSLHIASNRPDRIVPSVAPTRSNRPWG
ncbi:MAG: ComEC/Rec2 family competence protein [Pseudomonadota bacterium]